MPGVNPPSDGGYNYYQKSLSDLEEELKTENKRSTKRMEERTQALEENYKKNLESKDRDTEETIRSVRESANQSIANDRKYSKAEVDRIKNETYDKWGRYNGQEADTVTHQMEDLRRSTDERHLKDRRDLTETENNAQTHLDEERAQHQADMEKFARNAHDSANDSYSQAYKGQMSEYDSLKDESQKKYEQLTQNHLDEMNANRQQTTRFIADTKRDYDRKAQRFKDSNDERFDKLNTSHDRSLLKATQDLGESRANETAVLRGQLQEFLSAENRYEHEKGEGTQKAIDEYDDQWRHRERVVSDDYQKQIERLKQQGKESDRYYTHLNNNNLRDKDAYFTKIISDVNRENHTDRKDLEGTFNRDRAQMEIQMKHDRETAENNLIRSLDNAAENRNTALEYQAKAYENTLARQRTSDQERVKTLEKELNTRSTSDDAALVSPAAEAALRKQMIHEYEKNFGAERERNERAMDSMQREYVQRVNDTLDDKRSTETSLRKSSAVDREIERARLLAHIQDTEATKDEALRNKEFETNRQTDLLNRNYAQLLEKQRREFDEVLQTGKNDSSYKLIAQRQEADFSLKLAQRAFTTRQNELIRDYDKKLAEQKAEYETVIDDLKTESQMAIRDNDRKNKQLLDEQARAFEQRIAQAEYTHKERERYMAQNNQEQLEKAQRSNALLIKKKS